MNKTIRLSVVMAGVVTLVGGCGGAEAPAPEASPSTRTQALGSTWWTTNASMSTPRYSHTAALLDSGQVLVAGGNVSGSTALRSAELYNPYSNSWSPTGSMNVPRANAGAVRLAGSNKVLVAGGDAAVSGSGSSPTTTAELYDPATGTWSFTGSMATPRAYYTLTLLDSGKVLAVGGMHPMGGSVGGAEVYDPATGSWSPTGPMSWGRAVHTATKLYSGEVLVLGGAPMPTSQVDLYNPATNTWRKAAPLPSSPTLRYHSHSATRLYSGYVMVAGGVDTSNTVLSSVDVYDPYNDRWFSAPPMNRPRSGHTAILLYSGALLVTGGHNGSTYEASSEVYDPQYNQWFLLDDMPGPRTSNTATLMDSGAVLVTGGYNAGTTLSSAVRFTP